MSIKNFKKNISPFWLLFKQYWTSDEKWPACGLLAIVIILNLLSVYLMLKLTDWYNEFYTILQNYSYKDFWYSAGKFTVIAFLLILLAVYALYLQQMLQIRWRTWMTNNILNKWLHNKVYYQLQNSNYITDNPDQRIQEDIDLFVKLTLNLGIGLFKQIVILIAFIALLWQLSGSFSFSVGTHHLVIPGFMVWITLIYSFFGTFITHKVGHQLINLNFKQQKYEADFRFSLMRLRENSECIAFYHGEASENLSFKNRFFNIITNFKSIMNRQKILTGMTVSYSQIAVILPLLIAAPRYFGETLPIGWFIQISTVFGRVQDALSYLVDSYTNIAEWLSVIQRLDTFNTHINNVSAIKSLLQIKPADNLILENLSIDLPNGKNIINNLNLHLAAHDDLIITGASGCGKSTLLRTLAQIWPFSQGRISITPDSIMFLPQKPYLPLGSLRNALYYPQHNMQDNEAALEKVLYLCKLDKFINQLETIKDWSQILSLGEQQRLAFARILLNTPQWLFLDESTSALDEPTEEYMYTMLKSEMPEITIISVGHRSTLLKHHKYKLTLYGSDKYNLSLIQSIQ